GLLPCSRAASRSRLHRAASSRSAGGAPTSAAWHAPRPSSSATDPGMTSRPVTTLDFDGVICGPPFGWNVGISRRFLDPSAEPRPARVPPHWLSVPFDYLRFNFRSPLPGVYKALEELRELRTIVILTGRRTTPEGWLRRYDMTSLIDHIVIN